MILAFGCFAFFVGRPTSAKNRTKPARVRTRGREKITTTSNTAVILSTEWEPSHPSTANIDAVIRSVRNNLIGLDKTSPILLALEHEEYVDDFDKSYSHLWPNFAIQVVGSTTVLENVRRYFPTVEDVYQLHDDLAFAEPIDHLGLIRTMEEPPREGVSAVDYVLFRYYHSEEFWQVQKRCSRHGETYKVPVRKSKNTKATVLAAALHKACEMFLDNEKNPGRSPGTLPTAGSHFYLNLYWAKALSEQTDDAELAAKFKGMYDELSEKEAEIVAGLKNMKEKAPLDIGGYFRPDPVKATAAMRPVAVYNSILDKYMKMP